MIFISEKNLKVKKMSLASKSLRILLCLCETIGVMAVGYVLYIFLQQFLMIALKSACYELRNGIKNGEIYEILFLILGIMLIVSIFIIFSYTISKKWSSKYIIRQKCYKHVFNDDVRVNYIKYCFEHDVFYSWNKQPTSFIGNVCKW